MRVELMAAESSSNRGKKESTASGLLNSPTRLNDDVEDPVKSPPPSPNNSSTRKWEPKRSPQSLKLADEYSKARNKRMVANSYTSQFEKSLLNMSYVSHIEARCRGKSIRPMKRSPYYPAAKACYAVLQSWVSKKFMTGCVVLFPVAVTFFITWWFIQFVDGFFSPIYERLGIDIFGLGFITSIFFIFFVGIFASSWLGSTVFLIGEWFIKRMPFVKHIYSASKQISSAISPDQNTTAFKEVAIIRHPRVGEYAFGFITSSVVLQRDNEDEELCSVYVPTNHLYIGDIFLVNSKDIIRPNLSIREGIEIIVSVGMSMPQIISPIEEHARLNDRIPPSRMLI